MARLPTVGGDSGNWGTILNAYLSIEHAADGTHTMGTGLVTENVNTVAASSTAQTIPSPATYTISDITLTDNCTITMPTAVKGQSFTLVLRQDATGSRTTTWSGTIKWPNGTAPTLSTTASKVDVLTFFTADGTNWLGFLSGTDLR